jgi:hypothetical protein
LFSILLASPGSIDICKCQLYEPKKKGPAKLSVFTKKCTHSPYPPSPKGSDDFWVTQWSQHRFGQGLEPSYADYYGLLSKSLLPTDGQFSLL